MYNSFYEVYHLVAKRALNSDDALPSSVEEAKMARHPWRTQQKQQRRIRASYHRQPLNQRRRKVTLGLLSTAELERLERELQELRDFADIFNDVRQANTLAN